MTGVFSPYFEGRNSECGNIVDGNVFQVITAAVPPPPPAATNINQGKQATTAAQKLQQQH